ncbi:MAG TPA: Tad domain-containing protein [Acidimicrobiales bacterium]|nr:Tad domain-containing protein [Acidimicrobiales bacterium]
MAEQLHRVKTARAADERGSVIPLVAGAIVMLLVMVALAVDLGNAHQAKGLAQSTTDSAALAGAQAIAGVKNGGAPQGGVSQAVYDAANWAFQNLSLPMPSPTKSCGGDPSKTCYAAADPAGTTVEVTTPYTPSRTKPDGTAYAANELIHVRTCWNNQTFIARVIGISTVRVCSEATARGSGVIHANTDMEDETNDPFARCSSDTDIFDTSHWFPTNNPSKDIPGKNNWGATYLYTTNLDPSSIVFTMSSQDPFEIGGQPSAKVHEFTVPSPYIKVDPKPAPNGGPDAQGRYKWEIKFTNYTALDGSGNGKDAKNFKDVLPNGIYAFAIYAKTSSNLCNQTTFPVVINTSKKAKDGVCQEDLFRGGTTPASGTQITDPNNRTVTATYFDETPPFVTDSTDPNVRSHMMHFEIKGGIYTDWTDFTSSVVASGVTNNPTAGHEYKFQQVYQYTIPTTFMNGQYSFRIQVYDSDQNKAGGDCGFAIWTVNFAAGVNGRVELIE